MIAKPLVRLQQNPGCRVERRENETTGETIMPRGVRKGQVLREKKYPVCQKCGSRFGDVNSLSDHLPCEGKRHTSTRVSFVCHNTELNEVPA